MAQRSSRVMTSVFLLRDDDLLLMYRRGSRAIADSWVGVGGHVEPTELAAHLVVPERVAEGDLHWYGLDAVPVDLDMPPTAAVALRHWLDHGRHDDTLRLITMTPGQRRAAIR